MSDPTQGARCAICATAVERSEATPCPKCEVLYHGPCWRLHGGCAIYGCDGRPAPQSAAPAAPAAPAEIVVDVPFRGVRPSLLYAAVILVLAWFTINQPQLGVRADYWNRNHHERVSSGVFCAALLCLFPTLTAALRRLTRGWGQDWPEEQVVASEAPCWPLVAALTAAGGLALAWLTTPCARAAYDRHVWNIQETLFMSSYWMPATCASLLSVAAWLSGRRRAITRSGVIVTSGARLEERFYPWPAFGTVYEERVPTGGVRFTFWTTDGRSHAVSIDAPEAAEALATVRRGMVPRALGEYLHLIRQGRPVDFGPLVLLPDRIALLIDGHRHEVRWREVRAASLDEGWLHISTTRESLRDVAIALERVRNPGVIGSVFRAAAAVARSGTVLEGELGTTAGEAAPPMPPDARRIGGHPVGPRGLAAWAVAAWLVTVPLTLGALWSLYTPRTLSAFVQVRWCFTILAAGLSAVAVVRPMLHPDRGDSLGRLAAGAVFLWAALVSPFQSLPRYASNLHILDPRPEMLVGISMLRAAKPRAPIPPCLAEGMLVLLVIAAVLALGGLALDRRVKASFIALTGIAALAALAWMAF